jgi:glucose/mannose-6-phosphate isomerase
MNSIIDSNTVIKDIDKGGIYDSITLFPKQLSHAWESLLKVSIPDSYLDVENILMCGMGGSGLGARIIESVYRNDLKIPLVRVNDYNIPSFVDDKTLVVVTSYSGNTAESISNLLEAHKRNAKIFTIATGGKLIEHSKEFNIPFLTIDPVYNPSNQPRMAMGYLTVSQLALLSRCKLIDFDSKHLSSISQVAESLIDKYKVEVPGIDNLAKKIALQAKDKILLFMSAEHLVGAVHAVNNQFNENAKSLTFDFTIPEANHHLLEGLKFPLKNRENVAFILFNSSMYSENIRKRFLITKEVILENGIGVLEYTASSQLPISQAFEIIQFGSFLAFYLAILYKQDPTPIVWVDYFKKRINE